MKVYILIFERRPVSHLLVVLRKRKRKGRHMIRRAQFFDGFCGWIQPEEMRESLLFGGKINSIRSPADETGIFIKGFRQDLRRSAFSGHAPDSYILALVILLSTC